MFLLLILFLLMNGIYLGSLFFNSLDILLFFVSFISDSDLGNHNY